MNIIKTVLIAGALTTLSFASNATSHYQEIFNQSCSDLDGKIVKLNMCEVPEGLLILVQPTVVDLLNCGNIIFNTKKPGVCLVITKTDTEDSIVNSIAPILYTQGVQVIRARENTGI